MLPLSKIVLKFAWSRRVLLLFILFVNVLEYLCTQITPQKQLWYEGLVSPSPWIFMAVSSRYGPMLCQMRGRAVLTHYRRLSRSVVLKIGGSSITRQICIGQPLQKDSTALQ